MNVITVIPISRGIPIDELSYFTAQQLSPGALVHVPLRGKRMRAIVVDSTPASNAKTELKQAGFALRKLETVEATAFFAHEFLTAVKATAGYFACTVGAVIRAVFPEPLFAAAMKQTEGAKPIQTNNGLAEQYIFQAEDSERFAAYKSLIRETFAKNSSVFLALPSIQDIERVYGEIERGIRDYTFVLHGAIPKKTLTKRLDDVLAMNHPVLIIGTPYFLAIPRHDIATIIIDKESSPAYKLSHRPFIDLRFFAEQFARARKAQLILGDLFLRTETLYRAERGDFESFTRPKLRIISPATQSLIDMRKSGEQPATGKVAICSRELVDLIEENRATGTHLFILGVRRGYAPMIVCGDCGTVVTCVKCSAPIVLHKRNKKVQAAPVDPSNVPQLNESGEQDATDEHETIRDAAHGSNIFLCHRCGHERDPDDVCVNCGGWRLVTLGIGTAQAEEAIRNRFPDAPIFRIDRDNTKTHKEAQEAAQQFYASPGSILLGTEMALPYLTEKIATVAVLSVNSLLTIPDFRMNEKVFRLLLGLRGRAERHFLVQTRDPSQEIFQLALGGNIGEFFRSELALREALNYSPYAVLIKFTYEGTKQDGVEAMEEIERLFGAYQPVRFLSFIAKVNDKYRFNALIRVPEKEWPHADVVGLIKALPPEIEVRIDPESVL